LVVTVAFSGLVDLVYHFLIELRNLSEEILISCFSIDEPVDALAIVCDFVVECLPLVVELCA
jgi:hypothetical protein